MYSHTYTYMFSIDRKDTKMLFPCLQVLQVVSFNFDGNMRCFFFNVNNNGSIT